MSSDTSKTGGSIQSGTERGDDRRQQSAPVDQERRHGVDRRELQYVVKFKTPGSLVAMEDWLEQNCSHGWKLVLLDMDSELDRKEIQIMFADKADKDKFVAAYSPRR